MLKEKNHQEEKHTQTAAYQLIRLSLHYLQPFKKLPVQYKKISRTFAIFTFVDIYPCACKTYYVKFSLYQQI